MMTTKIEIELPSDLLAGLNEPLDRLPERAREWVLFELFREGRISSGKAAELLGASKSGFFDRLARAGIPVLDTPLEELSEDLLVALGES